MGVALNPATPLQTLEYVDMVLLMTVNPGFGGQAFIPGMLEKIGDCREFFDRKGCRLLVELDGGISPEKFFHALGNRTIHFYSIPALHTRCRLFTTAQSFQHLNQ